MATRRARRGAADESSRTGSTNDGPGTAGATGPAGTGMARARSGRRMPLLAGAALVVAVAALAASVLIPHSTTTPLAQAACASKTAKIGLAAGQCAPDFTLPNLDNKPVRLSDYRGRPVLIHFWGIPCPTCRAEYPDFSRAISQYAAKGLVVLAVDTWQDPPSQLQSWQQSHHLPITILPNGLLTVAPRYGVTGTPTSYFIDRQGRIAASFPGPLSYADYQKDITAIL